jgi:hypothetical protein
MPLKHSVAWVGGDLVSWCEPTQFFQKVFMGLTNTLADELRGIRISWIWGAAFFIVLIFGLGLTPWDAIQALVANRGVGDEGAKVLAFIAGYTLPLTVGFGIISFLALTGESYGFNGQAQFIGAAIILWITGEVARGLSLGLLPDYSNAFKISGPGYLRPLLIVLVAYLNRYGWPLMVCALAIGAAAGIQAERWLHAANDLGEPGATGAARS